MRALIKLDKSEKAVEITGFPKGIERLGTDGSMKLLPGKIREITIDEYNYIEKYWKQYLSNVKITLVELKP